MTTSDKDFIVAIELASSKIKGVAGQKKDGTMHILAYAEDDTAGCIKRGAVYNIEKTYQSVNNIIHKLESVLNTKISRAYVGIGGQSMRSYKSIIKRDLLTQSFISNELIDAISQESQEIPYSDYEVMDNSPQEFIIDSNSISDTPVGVMGTNVEGEFLNIIAKTKLRTNVETVFANANMEIAEQLIAPLQLANNVLTDAEKRSGCALVDLGADTTTLVVYKNNIVRYLVTIPLGSNNINKDLATLPIDEAETEEVKLKYGDACQDTERVEDAEIQTYTTSDGRTFDVTLIKNVIEARMGEIIANVNNQIINSDYSGKLLAGLVITGGGSNMKNIVDAFTKSTKIDKVRIANKVNQSIIKTEDAGSIVLDKAENTSILSLLLGGTEPCGGEGLDNTQAVIDQQTKEADRQRRQEEAEAEAKDAMAFDKVKNGIRDAYDEVQKQITELNKYGSDKAVRQKAKNLSLKVLDATIGDEYANAAKALEGKDKFKQSLREGAELAEKLKVEVDKLIELVNRKNKENSFIGRISRALSDLVSEDEGKK